ncbi:hypothetical protein [Saccharothrix sp. Mg75]|uniref:hypothetical protein n=1 Tax=Saccharothrix sp. Mg75 TaxID=3445357 RepID=UPI003EEA62F1
MTALDRRALIALVERFQRGEVAEEEDDVAVAALVAATGNPHVLQLIFYPEDDDVTAGQIVEQALAYRPIAL